MSVEGQSRHLDPTRLASGLPWLADIAGHSRCRFRAKAEIFSRHRVCRRRLSSVATWQAAQPYSEEAADRRRDSIVEQQPREVGNSLLAATLGHPLPDAAGLKRSRAPQASMSEHRRIRQVTVPWTVLQFRRAPVPPKRC